MEFPDKVTTMNVQNPVMFTKHTQKWVTHIFLQDENIPVNLFIWKKTVIKLNLVFSNAFCKTELMSFCQTLHLIFAEVYGYFQCDCMIFSSRKPIKTRGLVLVMYSFLDLVKRNCSLCLSCDYCLLCSYLRYKSEHMEVVGE